MLDELQKVKLKAGELEVLEQELNKLENAEEVKSKLNHAKAENHGLLIQIDALKAQIHDAELRLQNKEELQSGKDTTIEVLMGQNLTLQDHASVVFCSRTKMAHQSSVNDRRAL